MNMKTPDKAVTLFDEAAATWDKPIRVELARGVARAITTSLPLNQTMTAMEFGCGTGLVTALLAPHLGKIVATDSSSGMLVELRKKIDGIGLANIITRQLDLTRDPLPDERYHLIYSSMTLHHIADLGALMRTFHDLLAPGGRIALADLASEDGTFHSDSTGVMHLGMDSKELLSLASEAGFTDLAVTTAHVITKEGNDGKVHDYPVLLLTGKR
ncbi:MAG: class I SAM-dependent methyltransferase [Desulfobulbaceae bacterium]|nr:class I SAM-dependent methyltransferase [Desulfobulbaceae bacterium]